MDISERANLKAIVTKHIEAIVDDISSQSIDVGYWPEDNSALVDVVEAVILHQARIDDYHKSQKSDFSQSST